MKPRPHPQWIPAWTILALVAFAANSLLNRLALGRGIIDAASFSSIRLGSGAVALFLLRFSPTKKEMSLSEGNWVSAMALFLYAVTFSFAYINLNAGIGALILFGTVQVTMIIAALLLGERPHLLEWIGLALALSGLIYLILPGLQRPSLSGALLMSLAGISWGIYSLRGRGAKDPMGETAGNFLKTLPMVFLLSLILFRTIHLSLEGVLLAVTSGALTSGLGYVIWYAALKGLSATQAAMVQLSVPILAAGGGVVFLSEEVSLRLLLSGSFILGGIALAVAGARRLAG